MMQTDFPMGQLEVKEAEARQRRCWLTNGRGEDCDTTWEVHGTMKPEGAFAGQKSGPQRRPSPISPNL